MTKLLTPETGRGIFQCGEKNINSKLTIERVVCIKEFLRRGFTQKWIAYGCKVSQNSISRIKRGITWRWLK